MFRFSIRELVLLTLAVALGVAWWIDRTRLSQQNRALRDEQKVLRFEALRAREIRGEIVLPPARQRVNLR